MYSEGTGKIMVAMIAAVIIAIAVFYWNQTSFVLRFIWDLIVINTQPLINDIVKEFAKHWPF